MQGSEGRQSIELCQHNIVNDYGIGKVWSAVDDAMPDGRKLRMRESGLDPAEQLLKESVCRIRGPFFFKKRLTIGSEDRRPGGCLAVAPDSPSGMGRQLLPLRAFE